MFVINKMSRIPYGSLSIYMNRVHHRKKYNQQHIRFFQSSTTNSFIFNTSSSSSDEIPNSAGGAEDNSVSSSQIDNIKATFNPVKVKWFYATDVPNSQPALYHYQKTKEPTKFLPFSDQDSQRLETQFQKVAKGTAKPIPGFDLECVPVHEDRLFECDLHTFELRPIYWEGASYEIRRGLWFDKDNMPLKQQLADKLEETYMELEPFRQDFDSIEDSLNLTKNLTEFDKTAVFGKDDTVYLLDNKSTFTKFQINYLMKSLIPPWLGVEQFSRGYKTDVSKEETNDTQVKKSKLDDPKSENNLKFDYSNKSDKFENDREIDHLVICVHGIGQVLGTKYESINFIHTINLLRQTMKKIFKENETLQQLAYTETENIEKENCKVQVLPIVWRHHVDLNSQTKSEDNVSLSDITIDGIRPLREILGDIVLDVLLYYEPHYMNLILDQVIKQTNEVYDKYMERNPNFNGKVSLVGHSLGSAICFDILCKQPDNLENIDPSKHLKFKVDNFFAIGSPIGVFSLLKDSIISPRSSKSLADKNLKSPKVVNFYNVFHPCDPVAYRIEPLICKEFANYQPATIPFASKNIDAQIQNLTQIGDDLTNKVLDNLNTALQTITPQSRKTRVKKTNQESHFTNVSQESLQVMTKLNYSGRVDYSLPAGIFDISIVSAINSHVSYFEEINVAGFLLRELLINKKTVKDKKVLLMDQDGDEDDEEFFTIDEEKTI